MNRYRLTIGEAAEVARVSPETIRAAVDAGDLRSETQLKAEVIERRDLDSWIRGRISSLTVNRPRLS
jgi:hypothetical protein